MVYAKESSYPEIEKFIENYYEMKDIGADTGENFEKNIDNNLLLKFLNERINIQQYNSELYNIQKNNYNVEVNFLESENIDDKTILKYQAITTFNYEELPHIKSQRSEEVMVIIDKNNKIYDFKIDDFFDEYVRNNILDSVSDKVDSVCSEINYLTSDSLDLSINSFINQINRNYDYECKTSPKAACLESSIASSGLAVTDLNGEKAALYAKNNCRKEKPATGRSGITYYDFSKIKGSYDCTNFASHAILAGGGKIYDSGKSGISSTGWYFRNINNRSSSWSGVPNLYKYLVNNTKSKTLGGFGKQFSLNRNYWFKGDLVQFKFSKNANWRHSGIIVDKKPIKDSQRAYAYFCGRSSSKSNNYYINVSDYSAYEKRTVHLYNIN